MSGVPLFSPSADAVLVKFFFFFLATSGTKATYLRIHAAPDHFLVVRAKTDALLSDSGDVMASKTCPLRGRKTSLEGNNLTHLAAAGGGQGSVTSPDLFILLLFFGRRSSVSIKMLCVVLLQVSPV